ncbi:MAG: hypothetical protein KGL39_40200 [Patescibacteria group bacterium]|nr:hypothetical protein [Patescibacteria group bacterium]
MSLPWFRMYRELKDDPKVGELDDASFRVFIESLCWACERETGGGTGITIKTANWAFRRNVTDPLLKLFGNGMLIEKPDGEIFVPKWDERQKRSDSSAERVRKFREKQSVTLHETLHVTKCNGAEERRGDKNRGEREENNRERLKQVAPLPRFQKPSLDQVKLQCAKMGLSEIEAEKFFNYYESNGWRVGRNPMKSWVHALTNWKNNAQIYGNNKRIGEKRTDMAEGTLMDGKASQYRGVGKVLPVRDAGR